MKKTRGSFLLKTVLRNFSRDKNCSLSQLHKHCNGIKLQVTALLDLFGLK